MDTTRDFSSPPHALFRYVVTPDAIRMERNRGSVLLRLKPSGILNEYRNLAAYVARGEARPAYKRAFDAQLTVYTGQSKAR
jgi:glutathione S-transferase